jgi:hypothetical protein
MHANRSGELAFQGELGLLDLNDGLWLLGQHPHPPSGQQPVGAQRPCNRGVDIRIRKQSHLAAGRRIRKADPGPAVWVVMSQAASAAVKPHLYLHFLQ